MAFYKKLNKFGRILWVAELSTCTDNDAIQITAEEYNNILNGDSFKDNVLEGE